MKMQPLLKTQSSGSVTMSTRLASGTRAHNRESHGRSAEKNVSVLIVVMSVIA